ncbi:MAG: sigma-70 family RNA polymerase sigma factor [Pseudomonadota bacterium]
MVLFRNPEEDKCHKKGCHTGGSPSSDPEIELALKRHYADFRKYLLRRIGDPATAEDVLQSFCVRAMQSRTKLRDSRNTMGWLYTVLRSVLMDHYRKETSRRRGENSYATDAAVQPEDVASPEQGEVICNCVTGVAAELRKDQAELLRRIEFDEEPRERVSAELGISAHNLRVRLHRARAALKYALLHHCGPCCEADFRDCYCDRECTQSS